MLPPPDLGAFQVTAPLFRTDKLLAFLQEYIPRRHEPPEPLVGYGVDAWFCQYLLQISPDPNNRHDPRLRGVCLHRRKAAVIDSIPFVNPSDQAKPHGVREINTLMQPEDRIAAFQAMMVRRGLMVSYETTTLESCTEDPLAKRCEALTLDVLLRHVNLSHLEESLRDETMEQCQSRLSASRVEFLCHLQDRGISKLIDRQRLANALGQSTRHPELYNTLPVYFAPAKR